MRILDVGTPISPKRWTQNSCLGKKSCQFLPIFFKSQPWHFCGRLVSLCPPCPCPELFIHPLGQATGTQPPLRVTRSFWVGQHLLCCAVRLEQLEKGAVAHHGTARPCSWAWPQLPWFQFAAVSLPRLPQISGCAADLCPPLPPLHFPQVLPAGAACRNQPSPLPPWLSRTGALSCSQAGPVPGAQGAFVIEGGPEAGPPQPPCGPRQSISKAGQARHLSPGFLTVA